MGLRLTEEEYAALMARRNARPLPAAAAATLQPRTQTSPSSRTAGGQVFVNPGRARKYGNERTEVDGIAFDSRHEANVYGDLMFRVKVGELKCVLRQVRFDLGGGPHGGKDTRYRYIADFVTIDNENRIQVIDAKSEITRKNRTYINKKKQMLAEWGIEIVEV